MWSLLRSGSAARNCEPVVASAVQALAEALRVNGHITEIDLAGNLIQDAGAKAWARWHLAGFEHGRVGWAVGTGVLAGLAKTQG